MGSEHQELVYGLKLSSIGPGNVSGHNAAFYPSDVDLSMKLHYIRGVYYFKKEAFEGLRTQDIKDPTFRWLTKFPVHNGRFRRDDSGRPYIKCNDCGVRFLELKCRKTLEEWLEKSDPEMEKLLFSGQVIGPELQFSPPVYLQLTKFEDGGVAVGVSWAHVLGDPFAVMEFMNVWGKIVAGLDIGPPVGLADYSPKQNGPTKYNEEKDPLSVNRVDPVGDNWIYSPDGKLKSFSFEISAAEADVLQSKLKVKGAFEAISAVIWKSIAKIRDGEVDVVTVMRRSNREDAGDGEYLKNLQVIGVVKAKDSVTGTDRGELAALLKNPVDEREKIEGAMGKSNGLADFIVYGVNLTFLDLGDSELYGFEYNRQRPVKVSYRIDGVGEGGVILVHQGSGGDGGRFVTAILPEYEVIQLKMELINEGIVIV